MNALPGSRIRFQALSQASFGDKRATVKLHVFSADAQNLPAWHPLVVAKATPWERCASATSSSDRSQFTECSR
jgi:hypothetical protein